MLLEQQTDIKIKSVRAKEIIKKIPSRIVGMGIIFLLLIFLMIFGGLCFINVEPCSPARTVLIINCSGKISGYLLLSDTFTPEQQDTIISNIFIEEHIFLKGYAILNQKELYLEDGHRFWKIPLVIENNNFTQEKVINGTMLVKGKKQSIFKWIITRNL